jgi:hypothetical protein
MKLTVKTYNNEPYSRCFILYDVESIEFSTAALGGYIDATITLSRMASRSYLAIFFNYHVTISDGSGISCWEGRIHSIPQKVGDSGSYSFTAVGYYANLADMSSTWLPYYPVATELSTIILEGINGTVARNGFNAMSAGAPALVATSTTVGSTGTSLVYTPGKASSVREHLDELVSKYGNSTNTTLYWQVYNNRVFSMGSRPSTLAPAYSSNLSRAASSDIGLNADSFYNRVSVVYKDYYDNLTVTIDNTAMQNMYAARFGQTNYSINPVPFIREAPIVDITNHGVVTAAQALVVANTLLNRYSGEGIRTSTSIASFVSDGSISLEKTNQPMPMHLVRAGNMLLWEDVAASGSTYYNYQSTMFIGKTRYTLNAQGESLELQAEDNQSLDNLLGAVLLNLDNQLAA